MHLKYVQRILQKFNTLNKCSKFVKKSSSCIKNDHYTQKKCSAYIKKMFMLILKTGSSYNGAYLKKCPVSMLKIQKKNSPMN